MSVLIKNMEMPKCCLECPFEDSPEFDSYCIAIGNEFIGKWEDLGRYKPDWCPLQDASIVGEWIPVSDRLPDIDTSVIICTANGEITDGYRWNEEDWFLAWGEYNGGHEGNDEGRVLAWMPLPEPYKGGEKE